MPKIPRLDIKPTMRLVTLETCVKNEARFGIGPLKTSPAMFTPIAHSEFELIDLPVPGDTTPRHGMPWEDLNDDEFRAFRSKLPEVVTGESIYETLALPQLQLPYESAQRTAEWHRSRAFAVTASNFAGTSENAETLLKAKTYPKRHGFNGNAFTEWGSTHEKHAEEAFLQFLTSHNFDGELTHPPHLRDKTRPYLGFSPDALMWDADKQEVALVEYKCPAYRRSGPGHPYGQDKYCVPPRYMPQLQGSLHLLRELYPEARCVRAWFVVWQPHQFFVTHVPYAPQFASRTIQRADSFFRDRFLPACADAVQTRYLSLSALVPSSVPLSEDKSSAASASTLSTTASAAASTDSPTLTNSRAMQE